MVDLWKKKRRKEVWKSLGEKGELSMCCCLTWEGGWGEKKGSASINSCYITSLCWCQVPERKERRESAMTLFFSVTHPHLSLVLSISVLSGFVSIVTDRLRVYPTPQGGPKMFVHSSILPLLLSLHSLPLTAVWHIILNVISALFCLCFLFSATKPHTGGCCYAANILINDCPSQLQR